MRNKSILCVAVSINALLSNLLAVIANWFDVKMLGWVAVVCLLLISISVAFVRSDKRGLDYAIEKTEASCITVGLFDTDSGVKRCEYGARSAECLQRAA